MDSVDICYNYCLGYFGLLLGKSRRITSNLPLLDLSASPLVKIVILKCTSYQRIMVAFKLHHDQIIAVKESLPEFSRIDPALSSTKIGA